jgi:hypothetical protein
MPVHISEIQKPVVPCHQTEGRNKLPYVSWFKIAADGTIMFRPCEDGRQGDHNNPRASGMPNQIEMPVTSANGSGVISSQPMANIIDENGRLFKPDKNGDFNQVNTDLSEEGTGLRHYLAEKGLVKHGHNDIEVNHVYNDLVAQFSNTLVSPLE